LGGVEGGSGFLHAASLDAGIIRGRSYFYTSVALDWKQWQ
jgi:hypothetical protein